MMDTCFRYYPFLEEKKMGNRTLSITASTVKTFKNKNNYSIAFSLHCVFRPHKIQTFIECDGKKKTVFTHLAVCSFVLVNLTLLFC